MSVSREECKSMEAWDMVNRREEQEERWAQQRLPAQNVEMVNIYELNSQYYQKIGEVWDHETKDFKVLYKPLYNCKSKAGSFEAHHLAVSTFERWNTKFSAIDLTQFSDLPDYVKDFIVSNQCVSELCHGNETLPTESTPLPICMVKGSIRPTVILSAPSVATELACRSDSGFGSRSLSPYFVLDFAPQFVEMIKDGHKTATTRVLKADVEGGEPDLKRLVQSVALGEINGSSSPVVAKAVTSKDEALPPEVFAELEVTSVAVTVFSDLTEELALIEQFQSLADFKICLRHFYPWIQDNDQVHTFYFHTINK